MSNKGMKIMAVVLLCALGIPAIIFLALVYHPWFFLLSAIFLAIPFIFWGRTDAAKAKGKAR